MGHAAGAVGDLAKPDDFVVLGGEASQRLTAEVGEIRDVLVGRSQAAFEPVDVGFQPRDLGDAWVWRVAGLLQSLEAVLELGSQVGVGPVAVEGGAVDACFPARVLMSQLPAGGNSPRRSRSIAARMRFWFSARCAGSDHDSGLLLGFVSGSPRL